MSSRTQDLKDMTQPPEDTAVQFNQHYSSAYSGTWQPGMPPRSPSPASVPVPQLVGVSVPALTAASSSGELLSTPWGLLHRGCYTPGGWRVKENSLQTSCLQVGTNLIHSRSRIPGRSGQADLQLRLHPHFAFPWHSTRQRSSSAAFEETLISVGGGQTKLTT